jgi:hypothetical protein
MIRRHQVFGWPFSDVWIGRIYACSERASSVAILFYVSTIIRMTISFDPDKSERNANDRGLPFTLVEQLDWSGAVIEEDVRKVHAQKTQS